MDINIFKDKYPQYAELLEQINSLYINNDSLRICIEGDSNAGKTTLANIIKEIFCGNIVHLDDFYLPFASRSNNWKEVIAGNMDLERFENEILLNLNHDYEYRPYSCPNDCFLETINYKYNKLTIIEGSYAMHGSLFKYYDYKIFLKVNEEKQLERVTLRNPDKIEMFKNMWIPFEKRYHELEKIESKCDYVLDTSKMF